MVQVKYNLFEPPKDWKISNFHGYVKKGFMIKIEVQAKN